MRLWISFFLCVSCFALTTAYVTFDQPDGWNCELAEGVWICQSGTEPDRKESIVLSIATVAGEWDTLDNYEQYLKKPRNIQDEEGNAITSTISYARRRNLNGIFWIDSLQLNSELPGFYSRYLATVHKNLAILITYIVSEDRYAALSGQFERMVASLKPNDDFNMATATQQGEALPSGSDVMGGNRAKIIQERLELGEGAPKVGDSSGTIDFTSIIGGVLILGLVGYFVVRIRRKRKV